MVWRKRNPIFNVAFSVQHVYLRQNALACLCLILRRILNLSVVSVLCHDIVEIDFAFVIVFVIVTDCARNSPESEYGEFGQ